jgi:hypothetical protein
VKTTVQLVNMYPASGVITVGSIENIPAERVNSQVVRPLMARKRRLKKSPTSLSVASARSERQGPNHDQQSGLCFGRHRARWLGSASCVLCVLFIGLALTTIPFGAPVATWYLALIVLSGAVAAAVSLVACHHLGSVVWWPVPVILVAFALSALTSDFPLVSGTRTWTIALYALIFFAAQIACKSMSGRKAIVLLAGLTVLVVAIDFWSQRSSGISLIREIRVTRIRWVLPGPDVPDGVSPWKSVVPSGSLGNLNDQAVVAILAPLVAMVVTSAWTWCLYALALTPGFYLAAAGSSRQLLLGLSSGTAALTYLRVPHRLRSWLVAATVVSVTTLVLLSPGLRLRVTALTHSPLGDRGLPVAYGVALYAANPIFGVGPGLYGHHYVLGVREGWSFAGERLSPSGIPWVHCLPVEIACELGTVGVVAYGAVLWVFVRRLRQAIRIGGEARDLGIAVAASATSMAVIGLVDLTFIKDWVRICWWLVLGLGYAAPTLPGRQDGPPKTSISDSDGAAARCE